MRPLKILLADAQPLVGVGQKHLLSDAAEYEITGFVSNSRELRSKIREYKPDLLIIDYDYPGAFSIADIQETYRHTPGTRILVVSANENSQDIRNILASGVRNYILKKCSREEFVFAVQAAAKGEKYLCGHIERVLQHTSKQESIPQHSQLSEREIEIIRLISGGFTSGKIARHLYLSIHTVATHRKNILKKLKLRKSSDLIMYALKQGLIAAE